MESECMTASQTQSENRENAKRIKSKHKSKAVRLQYKGKAKIKDAF
jgi:hypothetical protein